MFREKKRGGGGKVRLGEVSNPAERRGKERNRKKEEEEN